MKIVYNGLNKRAQAVLPPSKRKDLAKNVPKLASLVKDKAEYV